MTDWQRPRTVEHRETSLSFAVLLVDAFTGGRPEEGVTVALASGEAEPVLNPSGYHLFLDLAADVVTLTVDGGDRYVDEERTVVLADDPADAVDADDVDSDAVDADDRSVVDLADPSEPVVIELSPTPAYQFPSSTTLVRGHVEDAAGDPIPDATVSLREFEGSTDTTETGEYALFVPVTAEDVGRRDGANVVVVEGDGGDDGVVANGGTTDPTLEVTHPSYESKAEQIEVNAGTRTVHYVTLE